MPPGVVVAAVQLPGRETRLNERPLTRLQPLIDQLATALEPALDVPYALAGHSMGAVIAFELAREFRRRNLPAPRHLFVSARGAPQVFVSPARITFDLDDEGFVAELQRLAGTPSEVLDVPELRALVLPQLRADFAICETYVYVPEAPLDCPITAFGGTADREAPPADVLAWRDQTTGAFDTQLLDGGHFFFRDEDRRISEHLAQTLGAVVTT